MPIVVQYAQRSCQARRRSASDRMRSASSGRRGSTPCSARAARNRYRTVFRWTPRARAAGAIRPLLRATARSVAVMRSSGGGGAARVGRDGARDEAVRRSNARRVTPNASAATSSTRANGRSSKSHTAAPACTRRSNSQSPSRVRRALSVREPPERRRACVPANRAASALPAGRGWSARSSPSAMTATPRRIRAPTSPAGAAGSGSASAASAAASRSSMLSRCRCPCSSRR